MSITRRFVSRTEAVARASGLRSPASGLPRLPDLMRMVIWPQQRSGPPQWQPPLPTLASWLPGGDEHLASQYAQIGCSATSGFT